ncbi:MAG: DUF3313 family protein [Lysobacterales bacterium]|jgi:hypothetical protein
MTINLLKWITLTLLIATPTGLLAQSDQLPQVTAEGLHRVPDSKLAIVYADPDADVSIYDSVKILEPYVAFKKNWERQQKSSSAHPFPVRPGDMEKIKATLVKEFTTVFGEVLTEGGYNVTDQSGESVMLVRPAIIDLDPTSPETRSAFNSQTYVRSIGEMTLYVELYDSLTGDMIAKALDRKIDGSSSSHYTWANPATNAIASKRILRGWAEILRDALDEARQ